MIDNFWLGAGRADWTQVGLRSDYQDEQVEIAQQRTKRAAVRKLLDEAYKATGPITREMDLLAGGGKLYQIVSGEAQVVVEIMEERGEIIESRRQLNLMGKKPIKI